MSLQTTMTVGQLATEFPLATRVFHRHGIDYCCSGAVSLESACVALELNASTILDEVREEIADPPTQENRWDEVPLPDLIQHILQTYHEPLREELPRLEEMARKVLAVHRDKDPERLSELFTVFYDLKNELEQHMAKEEQILFPMVLKGMGAMADGPIEVMMQEHENAGAALTRLRLLTDDFQVPKEACTTWTALWHSLEALEKSLHEHIHLENNILFPRALES